MAIKDMSVHQLIEKFQITLGKNGTIIVPHANSLYLGTLKILKDRKPEILAALVEEDEEGFNPAGYETDDEEERDWDAEIAREQQLWEEDNKKWEANPNRNKLFGWDPNWNKKG